MQFGSKTVNKLYLVNFLQWACGVIEAALVLETNGVIRVGASPIMPTKFIYGLLVIIVAHGFCKAEAAERNR